MHHYALSNCLLECFVSMLIFETETLSNVLVFKILKQDDTKHIPNTKKIKALNSTKLVV